MRANGIGFATIVRPLLAVAVITMVLVAVLNEFYAPWASERARELKDGKFKVATNVIKENVPYYNLKAGRVWRVNRMNLARPNLLEGVRLSFDRPDGSRHLDITCRKAEYLDGVWWLFYPQYQYFAEFNAPIENPHPDLAMVSICSFPEFSETPRAFLLMNKSWEYYTTRDMLHYVANHPKLDLREKASKGYDIGARLIAPFSCLVITLFAIPAGVATGRQSVFKGVITAVSLFFAFYALAILCMILTKNLMMPATLCSLLPNLVFLATGGYLFYQQR